MIKAFDSNPPYKKGSDNNFEKDEIVWHTNFKCKVKYCHEIRHLKGRWFVVQLSNGGFMETQMIEKFTNQTES